MRRSSSFWYKSGGRSRTSDDSKVLEELEAALAVRRPWSRSKITLGGRAALFLLKQYGEYFGDGWERYYGQDLSLELRKRFFEAKEKLEDPFILCLLL